MQFGCFVQLEGVRGRHEGLVHVSQVSRVPPLSFSLSLSLSYIVHVRLTSYYMSAILFSFVERGVSKMLVMSFVEVKG